MICLSGALVLVLAKTVPATLTTGTPGSSLAASLRSHILGDLLDLFFYGLMPLDQSGQHATRLIILLHDRIHDSIALAIFLSKFPDRLAAGP